MKISRMIQELQDIKEKHGDIELTMTATLLPENNKPGSDVFASTVETIKVKKDDIFGVHAKLFWQT